MSQQVIPHRGRVFHFFWPFTRYVVTNFSVAGFWVLFNVLNRTIVIGRDNVGEDMNTLLLSNHQTMIDAFLIATEAFFPRSLAKPSLLPWHPAAMENFYSNPAIAWLSDNWRCIPVNRERKDFGAMKRMLRCLRGGVMTVFPEGTRSRDGRLLPPKSGIGYVMLQTRPKVIPVCMDGMDRVLPVGRFIPRAFNTIFIYYGPAVDYSEHQEGEATRETAESVSEKAFAQIRRQHRVLARYRRYRRRLLRKVPLSGLIYAP